MMGGGEEDSGNDNHTWIVILRLDRVRISSLNFSSSRDARVSATPRRAYIEKWWGNKGGRAVSVNANLRRQQNGDIYLHTGFWLHPLPEIPAMTNPS